MDIQDCLTILRDRKPACEESSCTQEAQGRQEPFQDDHDQRLISSLENLGTGDLAASFRAVQEDRCRTFKRFDCGFKTLLSGSEKGVSGLGLADYPALCASMTAEFAAIGHTIQCMKSVLQRRASPSALALLKVIECVQKSEKAKLEFTAALHLAQMRLGGADAAKNVQCMKSLDIHTSPDLLSKEIARQQSEIQKLEEVITEAMSEILFIEYDEEYSRS